MLNKTILGQLEEIDLQDINITGITARVDSGAQTSAIWSSNIEEVKNGIKVVFFGEGSNFFTGEKILFNDFSVVKVKSSNGSAEKRYKVLLYIKLKDDIIHEWFTLADRSKLQYPVLIGRNILENRYLIDV